MRERKNATTCTLCGRYHDTVTDRNVTVLHAADPDAFSITYDTGERERITREELLARIHNALWIAQPPENQPRRTTTRQEHAS